MGCTGGEKEERDQGTDSGIERMSSAGTGTGGGWIGRFGKKVRRVRIGSGGHSTTSSSPDDRQDRWDQTLSVRKIFKFKPNMIFRLKHLLRVKASKCEHRKSPGWWVRSRP